jgi:hypothetical protein
MVVQGSTRPANLVGNEVIPSFSSWFSAYRTWDPYYHRAQISIRGHGAAERRFRHERYGAGYVVVIVTFQKTKNLNVPDIDFNGCGHLCLRHRTL